MYVFSVSPVSVQFLQTHTWITRSMVTPAPQGSLCIMMMCPASMDRYATSQPLNPLNSRLHFWSCLTPLRSWSSLTSLFSFSSNHFSLACTLAIRKVPDAHYSTPASGDRRWKEESNYENTDLYENMPSPKLAARNSPKSIRPSSSTGHYNTPLSTKSLFSSSSPSSANTKTNQVTNPG